MNVQRTLILLGGLATEMLAMAQPDTLMLAYDEHYVLGDAGEDPLPELGAYEAFNPRTGGDSLRLCGAFPCSGWVEDKYLNGQAMHRGYYHEGRLLSYKNFHPNGQVEREFKQVDDVRSSLRTWHANGQLRSETRYADGTVVAYEDHYVSGQLRYAEERHRKEPCFTRLELYAADGTPISLLRLVDKGKLEVEQKEFHPGGLLRSLGRARYNRQRMDTQRIGTWTYFGPDGAKVREEDYIDGKVHAVR
jgi:antitoxin component YwqK of YwqJK toxin-antitoxin module